MNCGDRFIVPIVSMVRELFIVSRGQAFVIIITSLLTSGKGGVNKGLPFFIDEYGYDFGLKALRKNWGKEPVP